VTDLKNDETTWFLEHGQLDLGGIGKGWAIDQVATLLQHAGIEGFLINGGGDMYGTHEKGEPITIYLEHPKVPQTYLGTTTIKNQGFAASSRHKRQWLTHQGMMSHIVGDEGATDASFVIAKTALTADVLATTALILPSEQFITLATAEYASSALFSLANSSIRFNAEFSFTTL
jgi:thiamine biosynthesis lipoprotein